MRPQAEPPLIIIRAPRLISGTGECLLDQEIVVRDGRIAGIRPQEGATPDTGTRLITLEDATLLPGLIDAHVHLIMDADMSPTGFRPGSDQELLLRMVGNAQAALRAGVTTLCDCGSRNHLIFPLRQAITEGTIQGPRILASGNVITTNDGHGGFLGRTANDLPEIRQAVVEQVEAGADFIKIMVTGGGGAGPGSSQYSQEALEAAVAEARCLGVRVAAHCHGRQGIALAAAAGVDRIEHCSFVVDGVPVFDAEIARAIADRQIYVCPTNTVDYRQMEMLGEAADLTRLAPRPQLNDTWRRLLAAGVTLIAGSDAGISQVFPDDYALMLELMVKELGMSPMEAIMAGTRLAAEALGLADEIGTLETGKRADLVAVSGNPLDAIASLAQIHLVMVGGQLVRYRPAQIKPLNGGPDWERDA